MLQSKCKIKYSSCVYIRETATLYCIINLLCSIFCVRLIPHIVQEVKKCFHSVTILYNLSKQGTTVWGYPVVQEIQAESSLQRSNNCLQCQCFLYFKKLIYLLSIFGEVSKQEFSQCYRIFLKDATIFLFTTVVQCSL